MGASEFYAVAAATVVLATCAALLLVLRMCMGRRAVVDSVELPAQRAVADFMQQVNLVRKQREILEEHLNDYFQTFHEAGWPNLLKLLGRLGQVETQLKVMMEEGRYQDALELANLLLGRTRPDELPSAKLKFALNALLIGWKAEVDQVVTGVIQSVQDAAADTEDVGVSRRRKRQSTFLALHEIRDMYLRGRDK